MRFTVGILIGLLICILGSLAHAGTVVVQNVKSDFSAVGDAKKIVNGVTTNASGVLTSASNPWVIGDVGKVIWCIQGNGSTAIVYTTIAAFTNTGSITTTANATVTTTNVQCVWGTQDDTTPFVNAFNAAKASTGTAYPPNAMLGGPQTVYIPPGGYIVGGRIYNLQDGGISPPPALIGAGKNQTYIFLRPDMTIPGDGTGVLIQATGLGAQFGEFTVDGVNRLYSSWGGSQDLMRFIGLRQFEIRNLQVFNVGQSTNTESGVLSVQDSSHGTVTNVFIQDAPVGSGFVACNFNGAAAVTVTNTFCSNHNTTLRVSNNVDRGPTTMQLNWVGGGSDECGSTTTACFELRNGQINTYGSTHWCGAGGKAISVDGTSTLWVTNSNIGAFNTPLAATGMTIAASGKMFAAGTTFRGNNVVAGGTTTKAVANSGTFVDIGGNQFRSCTSTTCVQKTAAQMVSGNQPVVRE